MLGKISAWIRKRSTTAVTLGGFAVFVFFLVWVLPRQAQAIEQERADMASPDGSFLYSAQDIYNMADNYGPEGRADYIRERFTFDLIWPAAYMVFLSTSLSWLFRRLQSDRDWLRILNLVPVLGGLLDYLENVAAAIVMWRFPMRLDAIAWLASLFTPLKWVMIGGSFVLLTAGGALIIWQQSVERMTR